MGAVDPGALVTGPTRWLKAGSEDVVAFESLCRA